MKKGGFQKKKFYRPLSKQGQAAGKNGGNSLRSRDFKSGPQAWARRNQLNSTIPLNGGIGMDLLKKMGWNPGEGLGPTKSGTVQPLLFEVKLDKRGLVSQEDVGYEPPQASTKKVKPDITKKHPVNILNDLTTQRKCSPPIYTIVNESGPSHNKMFHFSVTINGETFTPDEGANTKKDAKVKAARFCLKKIGILP